MTDQTELNIHHPNEIKGYHEIAPGGDLLLFVESIHSVESTKLLVSSETLCAASPVFRKMLGPDFAEGDKFRKHKSSSSAPFDLLHPHDEPVGMLLLCAALHKRDDLLPDIIYNRTCPRQLLEFATMVDKYDCASQVKDIAGKWLVLWSNIDVATTAGMDYFVTAAIAAYKLDHAEAFAGITSNLLKQNTKKNLCFLGKPDAMPELYSMQVRLQILVTALLTESRAVDRQT